MLVRANCSAGRFGFQPLHVGPERAPVLGTALRSPSADHDGHAPTAGIDADQTEEAQAQTRKKRRALHARAVTPKKERNRW